MVKRTRTKRTNRKNRKTARGGELTEIEKIVKLIEIMASTNQEMTTSFKQMVEKVNNIEQDVLNLKTDLEKKEVRLKELEKKEV